MASQGIETGKLGRTIRAMLNELPRGRDYAWFYDHGDRETCGGDVAEVKAFVGERVTNLNRLAAVDFMLADRDGHVRLLAEVEERGVSPKKALGDVLAILMCRRCAVLCGSEQRYFEITPDAELIVAGALPLRGDRLNKINAVIQPRLHEMAALPGGISPTNVSLVFDIALEGPLLHIQNRVRDIVSG